MNRTIRILMVALVSTFGLTAQTNNHLVELGHMSVTGTRTNDIWGYADADGNEYALIGTESDFRVVDVTNPSTPVELFQIPGAISTWRDIKVWDHYAYIMHDGHFGPSNYLLIVDLDSLPNAHYRFDTLTIPGVSGTLYESHNLWIDDAGTLYTFGGPGSGRRGVVMVDLVSDPWDPTVVGYNDQFYLHDGYVRNDTLYGAAMFDDGIVVYDVSNPANITILGSFDTPSKFAHNCWTSEDGKTLFTTDEVSGAYVAAYDVTDLSNVSLRDKHRTSFADTIIPHNVHVMGNFAYTSYYSYGLHIMDIENPSWLVEVANFDTNPTQSASYEGNWGAYPFLPSGNILLTDRDSGLFIVEFDEVEAARVYVQLEDAISGVTLQMGNITSSVNNEQKFLNGQPGVKFGFAGTGQESFTAAAVGYVTHTVNYAHTGGTTDTLVIPMNPHGVGLDEVEVRSLTVYPNPSSGHLTVLIPESGASQLKIYSVGGEQLNSWNIDSNQSTIDLQLDLPAGIYSLQWTDASTIATQRIILY